MELGSNYHVFKHGVAPTWEDKANEGGGRWILQLKPAMTKTDISWMRCLMALVGELMDMSADVCGAVVRHHINT